MFKVETHEPKTLKWWHEQHLRERLDMQPPYQRRAYIWSRWKQAHLIDSILNGFDVPKFYVANFLFVRSPALNAARRPYSLIDGKQRFQAIFDYLSDGFGLNSTFKLYDDPSLKLSGMNFSTLSRSYPHIADRLSSFIPAVMNVITDSEEMIDELFVRLNSGEAATGAERRNAMPGPVPMIVRDLVLHPFFQHKVRFNAKRMQDFNLAAKLLLIDWKNGFVDTKARNLDDFAKAAVSLQEHDKKMHVDQMRLGPYADARDRVYATLERLTPVFRDKDKLLSAQGHIPVYYWLARNHPDLLPWFHDFLESFTGAVSHNLKVLRDNPDDADQELINYYTMGRTTNDQASLQGRFEILLNRLRAFANNPANKASQIS